MATKSGWQIGDRASILLDVDTFKCLQEKFGWCKAMSHCLGKIGRITEIQYHTVKVEFEAGEKWDLNPAVLCPDCPINPVVICPVYPFKEGDRVKIVDDERRLEELQRVHGSWNKDMIKTVGREGVVDRVFDEQHLRVEVAGDSWTFSSKVLIPVGLPPERPAHHPALETPSIDTLFDSVAKGDIETVKAIAHLNPQLLKENVNGLNALHIACRGGQEDVVSFLIGRGIDPNQPNTQGKTPLMLCCEVPSTLCIRHLLQAGAKPNNCGRSNAKYPLLLAVEFNLNEICKELLDSQECNVNVRDNKTKDTALHIAARDSNLNIVVDLLDAGTDPCASNSTGLLPIHVAIMANNRMVIGCIIDKLPDLANKKAKQGEYFGLTAVHLAILQDKKECLVSLLESPSVDLELRDDHRQLTPFLFAVAEKRYHMLELLHESGCDIYSQDSFGNNALHILFSSNCDNYDTSLFNNSGFLHDTFKEVEQYCGAHIRIAMCCYLIKIRVPYQRRNAKGVFPLSGLNPDIIRFCEDRVCLLPKCVLCDRLSEFQNSPCEHVTYCVVHAIDGIRCITCNAVITMYVPWHTSANARRKKIQGVKPLAPAPPNPAPVKRESGGGYECGMCYEDYEKVGKFALDPCGHTCCKNCGKWLRECRICRKPILKLLNIFDS